MKPWSEFCAIIPGNHELNCRSAMGFKITTYAISWRFFFTKNARVFPAVPFFWTAWRQL
jgi:hypothetical protein